VTELNSRESAPVPSDPTSASILQSEILSDAPVEIRSPDESSVEQVPPDKTTSSVVPLDSPPCWYHGIGEAMGWLFGTWLVHLMAAMCIAILLIINNFITGKARPMEVDDPNSMMIITAFEMTVFVLAAILAVSLRFRGRFFNELNFTSPDLRHFWIVVAATLPLTFCIAIWSMPIQLAWDSLSEMFPALKMLDGMNVNDEIKRLGDKTPLSIMIFSIAVLPAIGEELIFRGAIGRTLIANLGLWSGVLLTSFLFGWFHMHPVHALAVMPLGLVMHLVYLWSRSFWLPMLLHFMNNFWATVLAHFAKADPVGLDVSENPLEGIEIITAIIAVIAFSLGFWQSRVRLVTENGNAWDSGRFPLRIPVEPRVHRQADSINRFYWIVALVSSVLCHALVVYDLVKQN
jgi:uncharacterized protein